MKLRQGNVFTPVCHSVHWEIGCLPQCLLWYTPQPDTPWADTSPHVQCKWIPIIPDCWIRDSAVICSWEVNEVRHFYRPQTKFVKVMFLQVSVCPHGGGMVCMFFQGACMVFSAGACIVFAGGMHGFFGVHVWFFRRGACMAFFSFFRCIGYNEIRSMSRRMHPTRMHSCCFYHLCQGMTYPISLICMSTHKASASRWHLDHQATSGQPAIWALAMFP